MNEVIIKITYHSNLAFNEKVFYPLLQIFIHTPQASLVPFFLKDGYFEITIKFKYKYLKIIQLSSDDFGC